MILSIVIIYMIAMLVIGWWAGKYYVKNMTDYLLAGRRLGVGMLTATLTATHFGGGFVMGGSEAAFKYGLGGLWFGAGAGIGIFLLAFTTAEKFRDLSFYTISDYLEQRYGGKDIRILSAGLSLIALVGIISALVLSSKGALEILGITGNTGAILASLVFVVYTTFGGLWAATITDAFQIIIAIFGIVLAAILVLFKTGGIVNLSAMLTVKGVEPGFFNIWGLGASMMTWTLLPTVMYTLIGQDFYQRLFAAKDGKTAKVACVASGILLIILSSVPLIIGMGAKALSDIESGRNAFPWIVQNLMSPLIGGIVLAALLAAIMSTADSLLTAATSHIVKDFWIESFHLDEIKDEQKLLNISRNFTFIIGIVSVLVALRLPGIVEGMIYSYTMYTSGVFIPVIGGILWKSATREGALASLIIGSIVALWGILTKADIYGAPAEIYGVLVSLVVFIVVSLITQGRKVNGS